MRFRPLIPVMNPAMRCCHYTIARRPAAFRPIYMRHVSSGREESEEARTHLGNARDSIELALMFWLIDCSRKRIRDRWRSLIDRRQAGGANSKRRELIIVDLHGVRSRSIARVFSPFRLFEHSSVDAARCRLA